MCEFLTGPVGDPSLQRSGNLLRGGDPRLLDTGKHHRLNPGSSDLRTNTHLIALRIKEKVHGRAAENNPS